ncbi:MAG TPA: aminotransferase class III-fold pyridoxal phosphate-dependent enzyme [Solirubrobacteraceae bacterium]|nr:aminotransferase class III-fold pyridoxal phosphate-dependent enzyme [Solirubrobacteraceae bacterium]
MSGHSADEIRARARRVLPGGITRSTLYVPPHPPYAARGEGCIVTDVTGHQVIDANNNYTSLLHGHAHPRITAAATAAARRGASIGLPTESEVRMAEELRARTGIERWRFCNSGSEAVMMALRGARRATGRETIVRFEGSYHGTYDDVVDTSAGIRRTLADTVIVLPQRDPAAFSDAMDGHGDEVAAVLIDLMPNRAGLIGADPSFVELVRERTRHHGALMIVDEVITFRLAHGGLTSRYGVSPDLMTLGKVIGGGFPVGAVGGTEAALEAFSPGSHRGISWGGTFSANPVSMDAGLVALSMFDRPAIDELNAAGDSLRQTIANRGIAVNGSGSLLRLLLDDPAEDWWHLYRNGLLVGTNGLLALSTAMVDDVLARIPELIGGALAPGSACEL